MSLLLVRPFDIVHKGTQYKVLMVRVDAAGNRNYAVANDETGEGTEAFKWVAERWVEKVVPSE
ncbi:hypothetical protein GF324_09390 [bacterium]|nr:hypothetical protein [bacterium]